MKKYLIVAIAFIALVGCYSTTNNLDQFPLISLMGMDTLKLDIYEDFKEPGYLCLDAEDGELTDNVVVTWYKADKATLFNPDSVVNDTVVFIKYEVTDSDGNNSSLWRTIIGIEPTQLFRFVNNIGTEIFKFQLGGYTTIYNIGHGDTTDYIPKKPWGYCYSGYYYLESIHGYFNGIVDLVGETNHKWTLLIDSAITKTLIMDE